MSEKRDEIRAVLDPIVSARLDARTDGFAKAIAAVKAKAQSRPPGSDRVRAFSDLYRREYRARARIVFDAATAGPHLDGVRPVKRADLIDDLKDYVDHCLTKLRAEFEQAIMHHAGEAARSSQVEVLVDLRDVYQEQMRVYAKRLGAWTFKTRVDTAANWYDRWHWWLALVAAVIVALIIGRYAAH